MNRYFNQSAQAIKLPGVYTPQDVREFLCKHGWSCSGDDEWHRAGSNEPLTWEQAIAVEFMNFITLGGPHGR